MQKSKKYLCLFLLIAGLTAHTSQSAMALEPVKEQVKLAPYVIEPENVAIDYPVGTCIYAMEKQKRQDETIEYVTYAPVSENQQFTPKIHILRHAKKITPAEMEKIITTAFIEEKNMSSILGGAVLEQKDIQQGEYRGKEMLFSMDKQKMRIYRVRHYFIGNTQIVLNAMGSAEAIKKAPFETFFTSLRVLKSGEKPAGALTCQAQ